jgi:signal transduction histidine kinase
MSIQIKARGALNQDNFPYSVSAADDDKHVLDIDLRYCSFVDSYSVIELLIAMRRAEHAEGWTTQLALPYRRQAKNYIARMGLFELMPSLVEISGSPPRDRKQQSDQFLPVTQLDLSAGEFGIEELSNFAYPNLPRALREEFTEALAEIGSNVIQHADAYNAFVSGQRLDVEYKGRYPPRLHLVVGDTGIGIQKSLAKARPEVADMSEEDAIRKAIEPGVTGRPGINSGVGLYTILEYVNGLGGEMRIRSRSATVIFNREGTSALRTPGVPGTVVSVELCYPRGANEEGS